MGYTYRKSKKTAEQTVSSTNNKKNGDSAENKLPEGINLNDINAKLLDCPDIARKKVIAAGKHEAYFFYNKNLIDHDLIQRDFIKPILSMNFEELSNAGIINLPCDEPILLYDTANIIQSIISGDTVFICMGLKHAISCSVQDPEKRSIEEPEVEKNIRGPHDGFVESLDTNFSMLRKRIKNSSLKFKTATLGSQTNQKAALAYIDGIANADIVSSLFKKITDIETDGLPAIGYIEQMIQTHPNSLFPQFLATERPDKAVSALLEGRIVIMLDGTPVILIAPITFMSFFQALDDYSTSWIHGSFLRMVRMAALFIAIMLPSLYIAVTTFHYYVVPLNLLIPLAESRARVPFPPVIEVLILEAIVEIIREAAVRLPTYIGTAIGVFASLVIGQAAVTAGIVSNILIVIVAASAVASFVIPSFDMSMAIRILRFCFTLASAALGIIGIMICLALVLAHLVSMESLGQPYFQPFAPVVLMDLKDTFVRLPVYTMKKRPTIAKTRNKSRGGKNGRT